ncbi:MAG TPA: C-GCAxxG-C-C family (seleno)protein [Dehalococcoidales bacterium]|nr:C-GCAxxG-C-C family (seleno)protein [Dehalococcoidales bacterium]
MSDVELAVGCFEQGFSCSQSVLATYGPRFGLERELALKVASGLGGGIGHQGGTCRGGDRRPHGHRAETRRDGGRR